jgi:hypothetical protein
MNQLFFFYFKMKLRLNIELTFYFSQMNFDIFLLFAFIMNSGHLQGHILIEIKFSFPIFFLFYKYFLHFFFVKHLLISFLKGSPPFITSSLEFFVIFLKNSFSSHICLSYLIICFCIQLIFSF